MPATGTSLGRVARVDTLNPASMRFRLAGQERPQLVERPGVQTAARFPAALFHAAADMSQVLNDDHGARLDGFNDTPTEHVVAIAAETVDLPGQFAEVPFGRAGAFRLKRTLQSEVPAVYFPPAFEAKEAVVGTDGGPAQAKVHADNSARRLEFHIRQGDDDVQPEPSLTEDQVGAVETDSLSQEGLGVWVDGEFELHPPLNAGEADCGCIPLGCVGTGIVPNRNQRSGWAGRFAALLFQGKGRSYRFRRPHTRRDNQLGREIREPLPKSVVGSMVQPDTVLLVGFPSGKADSVEAHGMLSHRLQKRGGLVGGRIETEPDRSLHVHIVTHFTQERKEERRFLPSLTEGVSASEI